MDNAKQATEFFARWGVSFEEMCDAFRDEFAPDCIWDQRPIPPITGPDAAVRFLQRGRKRLGLATIDVEIRNQAVDGDVVHTERVAAQASTEAAEVAANVKKATGQRHKKAKAKGKKSSR
jgi:limonene-1,2-epoxide hydrolase